MNNNWKKVTSIFDVTIPTIDGKSVAYTVPVEVVCEIEPYSGEEFLTPESLELIEKTKARHMGLMLPENIQQLREGLQLTQREISDLLQLGGKTWSRWETGRERPSRSMNILLCALRDRKIDEYYLRALFQTAPLAKFGPKSFAENIPKTTWITEREKEITVASNEEFSLAA